MYAVMLTVFILICLVLMVIVLLQSSKGGGLAGAFGGGSSDSSVLGGRSAATFLSKFTVWLAVSFMAMSLILAVLSSRVQNAGTSEEESGIIARRQQEGALDVYDVNEESSILDQIQTEGFESGEAETTGGEDATEAEPVPEGD